MAEPPREDNIRAILLDIEGTTTPVEFVYDVLFPYARSRLRSFLIERGAELTGELELLLKEYRQDSERGLDPPPISADAYLDSMAEYLGWLMDQDRKSTPLKSIQGKIWEAGYLSGELKGRVFDDVPAAFERWKKQNKRIFIFSSGSALAQRLLFAHTQFGDLTRFISGYFDTETGSKLSPDSYLRIADRIGLPPSEILFVSDAAAELEAALAAGMSAILSIRPGNRPQPQTHSYKAVKSFNDLFPDAC
jgi:enolase-phosphatase E1